MRPLRLTTLCLGLSIAGCHDDRSGELAQTCATNAECSTALCHNGFCLDPDGDEDGDGLSNGLEDSLGTNALNSDTDGDGQDDPTEVGDTAAPTDTDGDGAIDAVESSLVDTDGDCLVDEQDADGPGFPAALEATRSQLCLSDGVCGGDGAALITLSCANGLASPTCDYSGVPAWQASEDLCDKLDNDCDGEVDEGCVDLCADGVLGEEESDVDCGGPDCPGCAPGLSCDDGADCESLICDEGTCTLATCEDGVTNGSESDVDCGAPGCPGCPVGGVCEEASNCLSSVCTDGVCAPGDCSDGFVNGAESDIDCGGPLCPACADNTACNDGLDCISGVCIERRCEPATCDDGVFNGVEVDVDCGGTVCDACAPGARCNEDDDCESLVCTDGVCMAATCDDATQNQGESSLDCGGPSCPGCAPGETCSAPTDCESLVCDAGVCAPATCSDQIQNQGEGGVDCAGPCPVCVAGDLCGDAGDCESNVCTDGVCQAATCDDGVRNADETDVDCAGDCPPCAVGDACVLGSDCDSTYCAANVCVTPLCTDGVLNGTETDVDCGGPSCAPCDDGLLCGDPVDCMSLVCTGGTCTPATCDDGVSNQGETGVDCSGPCDACPTGEGCETSTDCVSLVCDVGADGGVCLAATCADGVLNQGETDTDCGGPSCPGCANGDGCVEWEDCASGYCAGGACVEPTCSDGVTNGNETDVDCAGDCAPCDDGAGCQTGADCTSLVCEGDVCQVPACDDGVENGLELNPDCGGPDCGGCADGLSCCTSEDCAVGNCTLGGFCMQRTDVDVGASTTCIAQADGRVRCWGANTTGKLGIASSDDVGDDETAAFAPWIALGGASTVVDSANDGSCALLEDATVRCWGATQYTLNSALGVVGDNESPTAAPLIALDSTIGQISMGHTHVCARHGDGRVTCWGNGHASLVGAGTGQAMPSTAAELVAISLGERVTHVDAGGRFNCALLESGGVRCWGRALKGALGYGNVADRGDDEAASALPLLDLPGDVIQLSAGFEHACALLAGDAGVVCWGRGQEGQLGNGGTEDIGDNETVGTVTPVLAGQSIVEVKAGTTHTCARDAAGAVRCWGHFRRLGTGASTNLTTAAAALPVTLDSPAVALDVGANHSCARLQNGFLKCWGVGTSGALGQGSTDNIESVPPPVQDACDNVVLPCATGSCVAGQCVP